MSNKVFLGGTCNDTTWRDKLIHMLEIDYFNPVVDDWTENCIAIEDHEKSVLCNIHLYVITSDMTGVYSIAEATQSSNTDGITTVFYVIPNGFSQAQLRSLRAVSQLLRSNGAITYTGSGLAEAARILNEQH